MMTINEIQDEIIEEFSFFDDWLDKYDMIIELGKELPVLDEKDKLAENLIKGCQSRVWLKAEEGEGGTVNFRADSDSLMTKGMIALLVRVLSGRNAKEIYGADLYFIDRIGLNEHLSPTRSNGLASMLKQMKMYALVFDSKN